MATKEKIFVAPVLGVTFYVRDLDEEGKEIPIRDDKTKKVVGYAETKYQFSIADNRFKKGYKSVFIVTDEMPKNVLTTLEKLAKDGSSSVISEREWLKRTEPKRAEAEEKLDTALADNDKMKKEMEAMKAELERIKNQGRNNQGR